MGERVKAPMSAQPAYGTSIRRSGRSGPRSGEIQVPSWKNCHFQNFFTFARLQLAPSMLPKVEGAMGMPPSGGQSRAMRPQSCTGSFPRKGRRGRLGAVVGRAALASQERGHRGALDVDDPGVHDLAVDLHHDFVAHGGAIEALWRKRKDGLKCSPLWKEGSWSPASPKTLGLLLPFRAMAGITRDILGREVLLWLMAGSSKWS